MNKALLVGGLHLVISQRAAGVIEKPLVANLFRKLDLLDGDGLHHLLVFLAQPELAGDEGHQEGLVGGVKLDVLIAPSPPFHLGNIVTHLSQPLIRVTSVGRLTQRHSLQVREPDYRKVHLPGTQPQRSGGGTHQREPRSCQRSPPRPRHPDRPARQSSP